MTMAAGEHQRPQRRFPPWVAAIMSIFPLTVDGKRMARGDFLLPQKTFYRHPSNEAFQAASPSFRDFSGLQFRRRPDRCLSTYESQKRPGRHWTSLTNLSVLLSVRRNDLEVTTEAEPSSFSLAFAIHNSIGEIDPQNWNLCANFTTTTFTGSHVSRSPFTRYEWIHSLETTGCACSATGWSPRHVEVRMLSQDGRQLDEKNNSSVVSNATFDHGTIVGYVPLYLKSHSMGEFIFDQMWAQAAYQSFGINYYPKLLAAIPFTPATGPRILFHPNTDRSTRSGKLLRQAIRQGVGAFLRQVAQQNDLSSVHLNFVTPEEATDLAGSLQIPQPNQTALGALESLFRTLQRPKRNQNEYIRRTSLQYHWSNVNPQNNGRPYQSFEDYLSCFKSKRRITIKRERQKVLVDQGIRIDAVRGRDILRFPGLVDRMYEIYLSTIDKMGIYGQKYLTLDFFRAVVQSDFVENLCFICALRTAKDSPLRASDVFAGTINIVHDGIFYGRYWGVLHEFDHVKNLHFECCYWQAIEYCIKTGLKQMQPGAGGGDYKFQRGFDPALIHSVHYITNPRTWQELCICLSPLIKLTLWLFIADTRIAACRGRVP
jgi:uncharacterized protein